MSTTTTPVTVLLRTATAAQWNSVNPVLARGEAGYASDTHVFKVGDGISAWNSLYVGDVAAAIAAAAAATAAAATATAAATSISVGTPGGVAPLDSGARVADANLPARLTDAALQIEFSTARENYLFASREGVLQNNTDPGGSNHVALANAIATAATFNRILYLDGPEPPAGVPATVLISSPLALTTSVRIKGTPGARILVGHSGAGIAIDPAHTPIRTGTPAGGNPMYPDFAAGATTLTFTGQTWTTNQHAGKWLEVIDPSTYGTGGLTETAHRIKIVSNTATVLTLQFPFGRASGASAGTHVAGDFNASPQSLPSSASIVTPIPQVWLEDVVVDRSVASNSPNLTMSYIDNVYEKNLGSWNSGNPAVTKGNAINHYQCSKIRSHNLEVKNAGNFGIFCYNSDNVRFYSPTTTAFAGQFGLQLKDCRDARVYAGHMTGDGTAATTAYSTKSSGLNACYSQHLIECFAEGSAAGFEFSALMNEGSYFLGADFKNSKCTARNLLTTGFSTIVDASTVDIDKDWAWEGCEVDTCGQVGFVPTTGVRASGLVARNTGFEALSVGGFTVKSGANETAYYPVRDIKIDGMLIENCCTAHGSGASSRSAPVLVGTGVLRFKMRNVSTLRNRAGDNIMRLLREAAAVAASGSNGTNDNVLAKAAADYTEAENWAHVDTPVITTALLQDFVFIGGNSRARGSSRGDLYFGTPTINKVDYGTATAGLLATNNLSDLISASAARANLSLGNVDNTSDVNKPVSTAQATAIAARALLVSGRPALTDQYNRLIADADDGRIDVHGYSYPIVGYGGNTAIRNTLSPVLLDLTALNTTRMLWMPGVSGNIISTPDGSQWSGNLSGSPTVLTIRAKIVTHELDPITSQSLYFIGGKPSCWLLQLTDAALPQMKVFDSLGAQTATSTAPLPTKTAVDLYAVWTPSNATGVWQCDFQTSDDGGVTFAPLGDPIVGTRSTGAYLTASGATQGVVVGQQGSFTSLFVGGIVSWSASAGATLMGEAKPSQWTAGSTGGTDTPGNTWTIASLQSSNWVTATSIAVYTGERLTVSGSSVLTTPGIYSTYAAGGVSWDLSRNDSLVPYRDSNAVVNIAAAPTTVVGFLSVDPDGSLNYTSPSGTTTKVALG